MCNPPIWRRFGVTDQNFPLIEPSLSLSDSDAVIWKPHRRSKCFDLMVREWCCAFVFAYLRTSLCLYICSLAWKFVLLLVLLSSDIDVALIFVWYPCLGLLFNFIWSFQTYESMNVLSSKVWTHIVLVFRVCFWFFLSFLDRGFLESVCLARLGMGLDCISDGIGGGLRNLVYDWSLRPCSLKGFEFWILIIIHRLCLDDQNLQEECDYLESNS